MSTTCIFFVDGVEIRCFLITSSYFIQQTTRCSTFFSQCVKTLSLVDSFDVCHLSFEIYLKIFDMIGWTIRFRYGAILPIGWLWIKGLNEHLIDLMVVPLPRFRRYFIAYHAIWLRIYRTIWLRIWNYLSNV